MHGRVRVHTQWQWMSWWELAGRERCWVSKYGLVSMEMPHPRQPWKLLKLPRASHTSSFWPPRVQRGLGPRNSSRDHGRCHQGVESGDRILGEIHSSITPTLGHGHTSYTLRSDSWRGWLRGGRLMVGWVDRWLCLLHHGHWRWWRLNEHHSLSRAGLGHTRRHLHNHSWVASAADAIGGHGATHSGRGQLSRIGRNPYVIE